MKSDLFYKYYDALFKSKDYSFETETVLQIAEKYGREIPQKILEIGCGTGSHTVVLSKRVKYLFALDLDEKMISKTREVLSEGNIENVTLFHGSTSECHEGDFDMALALFNVITYVNNENELLELFRAVQTRLRSGGIFIFDCWNGIAAIKDPPREKKTEVKVNGELVSCLLQSRTDFMKQKTELTYNIEVKKADGKMEKDQMSFAQTLWTPMQIRYLLSKSGLEILHCCKNFDISKEATEADWKIMFVCRR